MSMILTKPEIDKIYKVLTDYAKKRYTHQYLNGVVTFKNIMSYDTFVSKFDIDESLLINNNEVKIDIEDFANNPDFSMLAIPEAYDEELTYAQHLGGTLIDWSSNLIVNKVFSDIRDFMSAEIQKALIKAFEGDTDLVVIPQIEVKRNFQSNLESVTIFLDVEIDIPIF